MDASGEFRLREPFTTRYHWNKKHLQCTSVVTEIQQAKLLELRHSSPVAPGAKPDLEICERITLEQIGNRTNVTKRVLIKNHGIPWLVMPMIWLINRFGKPAEVHPLKLMCEHDG